MKTFVLDASLALEWFAVGASTEVLAKRSLLDDHVAVVPTLWRFEVMNAVTTWRRRGDISHADCAVLLHDIMQIPSGLWMKETRNLWFLWRLRTDSPHTTPHISG